MGEFSLAELLESRRGEDLDLWARTINPQFARVLRTIGFDRTWARAEGAYLFDENGDRYLDSDVVFAVKNSLVADFKPKADGKTLEVKYDFVLQPTR